MNNEENTVKVSLHEAHQLITRITREIEKSVQLERPLNVYNKDINYDAWLTTNQLVTVNRVNSIHGLIDAKYALRKLVNEMNETTGISQLLSDEKRIREHLRLSRLISDQSRKHAVTNAGALEAQANHMSSQKTAGEGTLSVFTVPEQLTNGEKENVLGFEKHLETIRVKLTSLNYSTYLQLEKELSDFLKNTGMM